MRFYEILQQLALLSPLISTHQWVDSGFIFWNPSAVDKFSIILSPSFVISDRGRGTNFGLIFDFSGLPTLVFLGPAKFVWVDLAFILGVVGKTCLPTIMGNSG